MATLGTPTQGTLGGLPFGIGNVDFGVSEFFGLGNPNPNRAPSIGPQDQQTFNNLVATAPQKQPIYAQQTGPQLVPGVAPGSVQGASTQQTTQPRPSQPQSPNNYWDDAKNEGMLNGNLFRDKNQWLAAGGQVGGGGPSQDEINRQIDEIFGGNEGYFSQVESNLRGDFPKTQAEIEAQFKAGQEQLGRSKGESLNTIGQAEMGATERKQEGSAAARRLYNELMMGGRQRYGGASSAGQAFSELNAVEQQRRQGDIAKNYTTALREIENQKVAVENQYQNSLTQFTLQKDQALTQAQRDFDNKMLEVSRMRAANNQAKSEARLQALYDLRNQMYQIQLENQQFQQQLQLQREAQLGELGKAQSALGQFVGGAESAAGAFNPTTTPTSAYTPGNTTQTGQGAMPTGRVSRDEDLVGSIFNTPRREDLSSTDRLFANTFRF